MKYSYLIWIIIKQIHLTHKQNPNSNYVPLWVRVELGVMAMKENSALSRVPGLKLHHQMQFRYHIQDILLGGNS